jgi:ketosteroid isomerase-like protein
MKKTFLLLTIASVFAITSCKQAATEQVTDSFNMDSVKAEIAAMNKTYGEAYAKNDSADFLAHYTADAVIYPPNMPALSGEAGIKAFFNAGIGMGVSNLEITTTELIGGKESVAEIGTYNVKNKDGASLETGKFIVLWKQENGKWKMHRDIFNADPGAPPPPPLAK